MIVLLTMIFSGSAFAQEIPFFGGQAPSVLSFSGEHLTTQEPANGSRVAVEEQRASLLVPVYREGDDVYAVTAKGQQTKLSRTLTFEDRGIDLPDRFGSAEFGIAWSRRPAEGDRYAFAASSGSAGPRPLADSSDPILSAMVSLERPLPDGNAWIFFLAYSNNRPILNHLPLPGAAYLINGQTHKIVLGVPFVFGLWRPGRWALVGTASPFHALSEAGYLAWGPIQVYGNVSWSPRAYQNLLKNSGDHLIYEKKEMSAGFRVFFARQINFSLAWARDFDRRFLLGESLRDQTSSAIRIEDAEALQFRAKIAF